MVTLAVRIGVVAAPHVVVQAQQRQRHDGRPAVAVHDRFGQAGGAAGIHDPQGVVKRQPQRLEGLGGVVVARDGAGEIGVPASTGQRQGAKLVEHQQMPHAGQRRRHVGHHRPAVQVAATVMDAVAGYQHLGFDLPEAVQHRVAAHVGCANAPHGAYAGAGQERDHGLGDIGQVGGHAVTRHDTLG